jgi:hypothetical protein
MTQFDLYTLKFDSKNKNGYITVCVCPSMANKFPSKCSEVKCKYGVTFEEAKEKLISIRQREIDTLKSCKTYKEYELYYW